ncbi:MAG: hypothetical protein WCQ99_17515, partial [Pseudomonadota bacterium]
MIIKASHIIVVLACAAAIMGCQKFLNAHEARQEVASIPGAFYVGTDSCIPCHDTIYAQYK